jgi:hypothetical protein
MKYIIFPAIIMVLAGTSGIGHRASAHEGVVHTTEVEEIEHSELTDTQMRTIIALLQKLIFLLQMKQDARQTVYDYQAPVTVPVSDDAHTGEMEEHHEMHSNEPDVTEIVEPIKKLVIEVEEHNNATHVHVRYVDKAEEMFFVTAPISDENGVIRMIAERTGLSEADVRVALVYLGT